MLANDQKHLGEPLKNTNSQALSLEIVIQWVWGKARKSQVTLMIREVGQVGKTCGAVSNITLSITINKYSFTLIYFEMFLKEMLWTDSRSLGYFILVT